MRCVETENLALSRRVRLKSPNSCNLCKHSSTQGDTDARMCHAKRTVGPGPIRISSVRSSYRNLAQLLENCCGWHCGWRCYTRPCITKVGAAATCAPISAYFSPIGSLHMGQVAQAMAAARSRTSRGSDGSIDSSRFCSALARNVATQPKHLRSGIRTPRSRSDENTQHDRWGCSLIGSQLT